VTRPDNSSDTVTYQAFGDGRYGAAYTTSGAGIYQFRIRASGASSEGHKFTREKHLTAGIIAGGRGDGGLGDALIDALRERDERLCRLLLCLTSPDLLNEATERKLVEAGIDLKAIRKCIKLWCESLPRPAELQAAQPVTQAVTQAVEARRLTPFSTEIMDELVMRLSAIDPSIFFDSTLEPEPIPRPAPKPKPHPHPPAGGHFAALNPKDDPGGAPGNVTQDEHPHGHRDMPQRSKDEIFPAFNPEDDPGGKPDNPAQDQGEVKPAAPKRRTRKQ
jgi:hypothetical protein